VLSFTEELWYESSGHRLRVTCDCPGRHHTEFSDVVGTTQPMAGPNPADSRDKVVDTASGRADRKESAAERGRGAANQMMALAGRCLSRRRLVSVFGRNDGSTLSNRIPVPPT